MPNDIALQHQIHGVQPVLPVTDVAAAAAWLCRVLGFQIDFMHGVPVLSGRVRLGDRSWGDRVYIHLSPAALPVPPCRETRLHVGRDIDGLHARAQASGATVLMAPTDPPWGLREMRLQGPDGHRLLLGAETARPPDPAPA